MEKTRPDIEPGSGSGSERFKFKQAISAESLIKSFCLRYDQEKRCFGLI